MHVRRLAANAWRSSSTPQEGEPTPHTVERERRRGGATRALLPSQHRNDALLRNIRWSGAEPTGAESAPLFSQCIAPIRLANACSASDPAAGTRSTFTSASSTGRACHRTHQRCHGPCGLSQSARYSPRFTPSPLLQSHGRPNSTSSRACLQTSRLPLPRTLLRWT